MGYERNDRRYGGYGDDRARFGQGRGDDRNTDYRGQRFDDDRAGRRDYGRDPSGYDYQDRGFFDRAGDEVRSWFGDEDAERRRQADERNYARDYGYGDRNREQGDRGQGRREWSYGQGGRYAGDYSTGFAPGGGTGGNGGGYSPSDYGAGRGAGATGNWGLGAGRDRNDWGSDTGYRSWRDRQIEQHDRDYDEYRREHQQKFDSEFHSWRQNRQGQRDQLAQVQEHFEVVGSDGQHVGTVDHVRGDHIKLTKTDKDAGGHHHAIPSSWIQSVADKKVTIAKTADQAKQHWKDEDRNRGDDFFGNRDRDRAFDRSFTGNY